MSDIAELTFADDITTEYANVVLYGQPGCGKSTAAASAPGPLLWLNLEGRNSTAFARKWLRENGGKIREVIAAEQHVPLLDLLRLFVTEARTGQYGTVVVDTLGALRSQLVKSMVVKNSKNSRQQYGQVADEMTAFVLALRDSPVNVVLLSHEDIVSDDDGRVLKVQPMIGGKSTDDVIQEMDVVAYCTVVESEEHGRQWVAQYVIGKDRVAKDRSDGLGTHGPSAAGHIIPTFLNALRAEVDDESDLPWGDQPATADEIADALDGADAPVGAEQ